MPEASFAAARKLDFNELQGKILVKETFLRSWVTVLRSGMLAVPS